MNKFALALAMVASVLSAGCVLSQTTDGSPLADIVLEKIVPGKSTRQDVSQVLGPPDEIVYSNRDHDPLFAKVFVYDRPRTRTTGTFLILFATHNSDTKYDRVTVFFDERGVVEDIGRSLEGANARYGMPW